MTTRGQDEAAPPVLGRLETLAVVSVVGVLALALGLVALVLPSSTSNSTKLGYTESGNFAYSATAPSSSVYGAQGLTTGEPILTQVVGPVHVGFTYRLDTKATVDVHGTAGMVALVTIGQGLSRQFPVAASTKFNGSQVTTSGTLPVGDITSYIAAANASLGTQVQSSATVSIRPRITMAGQVAGQRVKSSYSPSLPFTLDGKTLSIASGTSNAGTLTTPADLLKPSKAGSVSVTTKVSSSVPLYFVHPPIQITMYVGFGLAGLCLLLGLWLARPLLRDSGSSGERDRIRTLYGTRIVQVRALALPDVPVADVGNIDSLAELAKRYESMILQVSDQPGDAYLVWDNGMLYRYRPSQPSEAGEPGFDAGASTAAEAHAEATGNVTEKVTSTGLNGHKTAAKARR
ncbi:MAG: DUF5305 family protein [Nocardioidaceae bacterium]